MNALSDSVLTRAGTLSVNNPRRNVRHAEDHDYVIFVINAHDNNYSNFDIPDVNLLCAFNYEKESSIPFTCAKCGCYFLF